MTGNEFVRRLLRIGRERGVAVRFEPRAGKGSHGRLYYGERFTTVKDRRKEIVKHRLEWPVALRRQADGSVLVTFPDIPEALTEGDTEAHALAQARDCLIAALGGYVGERRAVPWPSPARGRVTIALSALAAAKIALYDAMRAERVGNTALAGRLGLSEGAVRRLVDLDHRSYIGQIETALGVLGRRLTVATRAA